MQTQQVVLPDGQAIQAEVAIQPEDLQRGLMYRESLAAGHGMLFIHNVAGEYPYWMFNCKISLDMIWMDRNKKIVEIAADVPPCLGAAETCPNYGGHAEAMFVLELASGQAARHGLSRGQAIRF